MHKLSELKSVCGSNLVRCSMSVALWDLLLLDRSNSGIAEAERFQLAER